MSRTLMMRRMRKIRRIRTMVGSKPKAVPDSSIAIPPKLVKVIK